MLAYTPLLAFLVLGWYLIGRLPRTDNERTILGLDQAEYAQRWKDEFGRDDPPARYPWRLPLEYVMYAWARGDLRRARYGALAVSTVALALAMAYAEHLAGPRAALLVGGIMLSSPALVGVYITASYVAPVSALWAGGLYALGTGHDVVALLCGVGLVFLRATSWWMAAWLIAWTLPTILPLIAAIVWLRYRSVVRAQGWALLLRGEKTPMLNWPQDGWGVMLGTIARRYEGWLAWGSAALVLGHWHVEATWLLSLSVALFVLSHYPRTLHRPKWVVGYMPEWALPVAVALGAMLG